MTPPRTDLHKVFRTHLSSKSPDTQRVYLTCLQHLETWAERDELDVVQLRTADLERFLADEGRRYSSATIQVRRAALRAFYESLERTGMIEFDPAYKLRLASIDHLASSGPVEYLTGEAITRLREHALQLGPISSLSICMLHETPASVRRIASLAITDFAQDAKGRSYAILGQSTTSITPWRISQQTRDAVEALQSDLPRLISPRTKNPNILMVKAAVEQTRMRAGVQTPNLAGALKHFYRRAERELCTQLRLEPRNFQNYKRTLLPGLKPLDTQR